MSKALCLLMLAGTCPVAQAPAAPSTRPAAEGFDAVGGPAASVMLTLAAVGLCVLLVWIIRRLANPGKLTLAHTPGRPNTLNPAHIVLVLMVWYSASAVGAKALLMFYPGGASHTLALLNLLVAMVLLAVSLLVAAMTFRFGLRRGLGLTRRHWLYDTGRGIVAFLAVMPLCLGLLWLFQWATPSEPSHRQHEMLTALRVLSAPWQAMVIFTAVILAPLAEEVFFRGLVQSVVRRYTRMPWAGIFISATFFALVHVPYWHHMPALFILAVVLGYNYERCGRLWAPILLHAIFNAVNIVTFLLPTS